MLQVRAGLEARLGREGLEEGVVHDELFGVDLRGVEVHELCQEDLLAGPEELHEELRQGAQDVWLNVGRTPLACLSFQVPRFTCSQSS